MRNVADVANFIGRWRESVLKKNRNLLESGVGECRVKTETNGWPADKQPEVQFSFKTGSVSLVSINDGLQGSEKRISEEEDEGFELAVFALWFNFNYNPGCH